VLPIKKRRVFGVIAGIDGGIVKKSFHGIDLILLRAVGVVYFYHADRLVGVQYFPNAITEPDVRLITKPYNEIELEMVANIERQIEEIETARKVAEKFNPDFILLDGSVLPHYVHVEKNSILYGKYKEMVQSYKRLYREVERRNVTLVGVVEDSRGTRFCEIVGKEFGGIKKAILERSRDTNLLEYMLKKGERTIVFSYSDAPIREFPEQKFYTFYLRTGEFDQPVRVDFLDESKAEEIASVLWSLTTTDVYSIPSVLIEADQRAKLSEADLVTFYNDLVDKLGELSGLREKRRNRRLF